LSRHKSKTLRDSRRKKLHKRPTPSKRIHRLINQLNVIFPSLSQLEIKDYQFGERVALEVAKSREQLRGGRDNWPSVERRCLHISGHIIKFVKVLQEFEKD
jgi:hypothetical protein